jgi:hypothetical protein
MVPLKDEMLRRLAERANVAQFVSFGPGPDLPQRHACLRGHPLDHRFASAGDAVGHLLALSRGGSVNVRSFAAAASKGGPFRYGLTRRDDVLAVLRARAGEGLHTIANETVDVDDGGVSGVAVGDLVEFAPGDTPRSVERPGTVALGHAEAMALLRTVYGFAPELDGGPGERVEFSLHPLVAGARQTHTIVWEVETVAPVRLSRRLVWPNRFSRHVGDKAFGLLVADLLGLPVPATTVVGRRLAPFRFGRPTGSGEQWLRTCQAEPVPGRFLTPAGLAGPIRPAGRRGPVSRRRGGCAGPGGVTARWRRRPPGDDGGLLVEGVTGFGDDFMLAGRPRPRCPSMGSTMSAGWGQRLGRLGPVRFEGPTSATTPGSSGCSWPPWRRRPPASTPASRPAGTASTRCSACSVCAT